MYKLIPRHRSRIQDYKNVNWEKLEKGLHPRSTGPRRRRGSGGIQHGIDCQVRQREVEVLMILRVQDDWLSD